MAEKRDTRQKRIIREAIKESKGFFTAEGVHEKVLKKEKIGMATVYRFLKKLRESNEIYSYKCDRRTIYSKKEKSHCHFKCQKTGKTIHFELDSLDFLKDKIPGSIESVQIEVKGTCGDCSPL